MLQHMGLQFLGPAIGGSGNFSCAVQGNPKTLDTTKLKKLY